MKKYFLVAVAGSCALILSNCGSSKKAMAAPAPKLTYETSVSTVIMSNCTPCHVPSKGGNKRPYDNFANLKQDIDEIIRRVELHPGDRGFMPFRGSRLSDSTIAVFKQWKADGMLEK